MNSINTKHMKHILLTIDVEDWFQVENFKPYIPFDTWGSRELRVERNVHQLLDQLDSLDFAAKGTGSADEIYENRMPRATFFVLGWIADKLSHLVREIQSRGHEIASHGYNHQLCNQLSSPELKRDLLDSKKRLEEIIGSPVLGYRAPSFAVDDDILKLIQDTGYLYDSSYNSFSIHGRYGKISLNGDHKRGIAHKISDDFFELPVSNLMIKGRVLPWGGGAYFRLIPLPIFKLGINFILRREDAYLFYIHPWELDSQQPRVSEASTFARFRHYVNLKNARDKLTDMVSGLSHCRFITCGDYLTDLA
jgi:polysaccharide deacetylase family protein (PEP-CTERM system associated)